MYEKILVPLDGSKRKEAKMSIRKQYLKTRPVCKATFRIPEEMGTSAKTAHIVG